MTRPLSDRQRAAIARKRQAQAAPDAEAKRAAISAAIKAQKREDELRGLCHDAAVLFHKIAIKAISPQEEAADRAGLKARAAKLGVKLAVYHRGVDCASIMPLPRREDFWTLHLERSWKSGAIRFETNEDEPAPPMEVVQMSFFDEE